MAFVTKLTIGFLTFLNIVNKELLLVENTPHEHKSFQVYLKGQYSARYFFSLTLMICRIISIRQSAYLQMTVLYREIKNENDSQELQKDLNSLMTWEYDWQMHFNPQKCFVMRLTHARHLKPGSYFWRRASATIYLDARLPPATVAAVAGMRWLDSEVWTLQRLRWSLPADELKLPWVAMTSLTFVRGWVKICVCVRACVRSCMNERTNELRRVDVCVCMHVYVGMCLCACISLHVVGLGLHIWIKCAWHSIIKLIDTIAYSSLLHTINDKWHLFLPWWSAVTLTALNDVTGEITPWMGMWMLACDWIITSARRRLVAGVQLDWTRRILPPTRRILVSVKSSAANAGVWTGPAARRRENVCRRRLVGVRSMNLA